jgi:hypothetical protein
MKHAIETHRAFPIIAWGTFLAFAAFTFYLTVELQTSSTQLSDRTSQNLEAIKKAP